MSQERSQADGRPRLHIRKERSGYSVSHGPNGLRHHRPTAGEAFETGLEGVGHRRAVIIFEAESV